MISLHEGKGSKVKKPPERVFTLRLNLVGCQPKIWRRLVVRESMWLSRLHDSAQILFDWFDYQTHTFQFDDRAIDPTGKHERRAIGDPDARERRVEVARSPALVDRVRDAARAGELTSQQPRRNG